MTISKSISGFFAAIALSVVAVPQAFAENSANGSETHNDALISESATPESEPLKDRTIMIQPRVFPAARWLCTSG